MEAFGVSGIPVAGWPLRLLHVPTMTSFARGPENYYGAYKEPRYNTLSYTWGRWKAAEGPSLEVKGISWAVPPVSGECFSVDDFERALMRISADVEFVWVDVACIDQDNRAVKMAEVGRQAQIFERAESAYIWLHTLDTEKLRCLVHTITSATTRLSRERNDGNGSEGGDDEPNVTPDCLTDQSWLDSVIDVLEALQNEPWFTSLWTLQEFYLRTGGILLSREAGTADSISNVEEDAIASDLTYCADVITDAIYELCLLDDFPPHTDKAKLDKIVKLVDTLGFGAQNWANSCVLYSATRFRRTRHPLDRVYGIMQVFDLQLGESVEPEKSFTLEELEIQLAAALAKRSPVWSQLWVQEEVQPDRKSWAICPFCSFPPRLLFEDMRPESYCTISVNDEAEACIEGGACSFPSLIDALGQEDYGECKEEEIVHDIMIDASSDIDYSSIPKDLRDPNAELDHRFFKLGELLVQLFGSRLNVVFLGVLPDAGAQGLDLGVGLLVLANGQEESQTQRRVGICLWTEPADDSVALEGIWNQTVTRLT